MFRQRYPEIFWGIIAVLIALILIKFWDQIYPVALTIAATICILALLAVVFFIISWFSPPTDMKVGPSVEEKGARAIKAAKENERLVEETFTTQSVAGFTIQYGLRLLIDMPTGNEWDYFRLEQPGTLRKLTNEYNTRIFQPFLEKASLRFHLLLSDKAVAYDPLSIEAISPKLDFLLEKETGLIYSDGSSADVFNEIPNMDFDKPKCEVGLKAVVNRSLTPELIQHNYTMITADQKQELETDNRYNTMDEALAVAVLKRRLEFQEYQYKQVHVSDWADIKTEQAGKGLRIKWSFYSGAPSRDYDFVGFRKTGGFSTEQFNETSNGLLVVQSNRSGEVTEFLAENETYFYTFMWRSRRQPLTYYSAIRFQVTMLAKAEREAIEATLRRLEMKAEVAKPAVSENVVLDKAVTKLLDFVKFDVGFSATVDAIKSKIGELPFSNEEKSDKIKRLIDVATVIRENSQPTP